MMIAIPVNDDAIEAGVCVSFGRAPYFAIYNDENEAYTFLKNPAADSAGGAGIKAAQFVADTGVCAVLTPRCGENSAEVLKAAGINIYKSVNEDIAQAVREFAAGELRVLTSFHAGFHGHGG